jgi:hypothetical protein
VEKCVHCNELTDAFNGDGIAVCEECGLDFCSQCLVGECEIETRGGEYLCQDCYSAAIDYAHDMQYND